MQHKRVLKAQRDVAALPDAAAVVKQQEQRDSTRHSATGR
jgi:hypothetical protein